MDWTRRFRRRPRGDSPPPPARGRAWLWPAAAGIAALAWPSRVGSTGALVQDESAAPSPDGEGERLLRERVLGILEANCSDCHGADVAEPEGALRIVSRASLLAGGERGPAIVPGDPDASVLIRAVRHEIPDAEMPFEGRLQDAEIEALARWVALGAPWPADAELTARASAPAPIRAEPATPEDLYFEQEIRPLLEASCFKCHGPDAEHVKGGLRMTGRAALLAGGDRGPALVPGDPDASLLVRAVRYADSELKMPPRTRLDPDAVEKLERWVALGAPWPGWDAPAPDVEPAEPMDQRIAAGRALWAFTPPAAPPVPAVRDIGWGANEIDAFVLARLESTGLAPSPDASPRELVRRAYFDLIGLPPTAADVERFEADPSPDAWRALVDGLLERPEYGERWARHWLDVVRYGETNGYERDLDKPYAWRYRDWVVAALNADMPYDRFVAEQLAGDELEHASPAAREQALIATGFWRVGPWDDEPADSLQARYDDLDDGLRTVGEGLLGLTLGCARCHDHKFDPIGQRDYYAMLALLAGLRSYEAPRFSPDSAVLAPLATDGDVAARWKLEREQTLASLQSDYDRLFQKGLDELLAERLPSLPSAVRAAHAKPEAERTPAERALLQRTPELHPDDNEIRRKLSREELKRATDLFAEIEATKHSFAGDLEWGLVARESGPTVAAVHVLGRGLATAPGVAVEPAFPRVLCASDGDAAPATISAPEDGSSSGRRRALADWIADPANPLTARVIVNRVWQHHFGRGIVATPNDFGSTGVPPTHPELLDWLARDFVTHGWSLKRLHSQILTSRAWRMSSRAAPDGPAGRAVEVDPSNELLWRQNPQRLEAEALRDAMLAAAGILSEHRGGPSFYPRLSREALASASRPGAGWRISTPQEQRARSVYACVKRGMLVPMFVDFDYPGPSLPIGARPVTTLATQALTLLNSELAGDVSRALAARAAARGGDDQGAALAALFEFALSRAPSRAELELVSAHFERQRAAWTGIEPEVVVQPRVPTRLADEFLSAAAGPDLLHAPREGWRVLAGLWGTGYNDTKEQDPMRGPTALCGASAGALAVEAWLELDADCELAGLFLLAEPAGDACSGLELALLPREGALELRAHGAPGADVAVLGRAAADASVETRHRVRFALGSERATVELDGRLVLDVELRVEIARASRDGTGCFGARAVGGALRLGECLASTAAGTVAIQGDDHGPAEFHALCSVAQLVLASNEFIHVD
jgi:mono/diheme cytochrome c family protein